MSYFLQGKISKNLMKNWRIVFVANAGGIRIQNQCNHANNNPLLGKPIKKCIVLDSQGKFSTQEISFRVTTIRIALASKVISKIPIWTQETSKQTIPSRKNHSLGTNKDGKFLMKFLLCHNEIQQGCMRSFLTELSISGFFAKFCPSQVSEFFGCRQLTEFNGEIFQFSFSTGKSVRALAFHS